MIFYNKKVFIILVSILYSISASAIGIPSKNSGIDFLVTFGNNASPQAGDDDFAQVVYFMVPESYKGDVYFRIFDPETSADNDLKDGDYDTATRFTIYSGNGTHTSLGSRLQSPNPEYLQGTSLVSRTFGGGDYNNEWFTFNAIKPSEGEWLSGYYVFKILVEGITGNDGNFYKMFMSSSGTVNSTITGSNAFTYEMTFALTQQKPHYLFPYITNSDVNELNQYNFDMDGSCNVRGYFSNKVTEKMSVSPNNQWSTTSHILQANDIYTFINIEITPTQLSSDKVMTFYFTDNNNLPLPIYAEPMGNVN